MSDPLAIPAEAEAEVGVREKLLDDELIVRMFTFDGVDGNRARKALDRIMVAALANLPAKTDDQPVAWQLPDMPNERHAITTDKLVADHWINSGNNVRPLYAAKTERAAVVEDWQPIETAREMSVRSSSGIDDHIPR